MLSEEYPFRLLPTHPRGQRDTGCTFEVGGCPPSPSADSLPGRPKMSYPCLRSGPASAFDFKPWNHPQIAEFPRRQAALKIGGGIKHRRTKLGNRASCPRIFESKTVRSWRRVVDFECHRTWDLLPAGRRIGVPAPKGNFLHVVHITKCLDESAFLRNRQARSSSCVKDWPKRPIVFTRTSFRDESPPMGRPRSVFQAGEREGIPRGMKPCR